MKRAKREQNQFEHNRKDMIEHNNEQSSEAHL